MKNNHKTLNRRVFTLLLAILSLLATQNVTATHAEIGGNDPTKDQMLAFMANYPENGSSNYKYFINRLNKLLKEKSTTEIKNLGALVQGDINYRYNAPGVTDAERAKIKAIAKQLNETYDWNLVMPTTSNSGNTSNTGSTTEVDNSDPFADYTSVAEDDVEYEEQRLKESIAELQKELEKNKQLREQGQKLDAKIEAQEKEIKKLEAQLKALQGNK